jgi:hypothetical protein
MVRHRACGRDNAIDLNEYRINPVALSLQPQSENFIIPVPIGAVSLRRKETIKQK